MIAKRPSLLTHAGHYLRFTALLAVACAGSLTARAQLDVSAPLPLSDEQSRELFAAIDLSSPELQSVTEAVNAEDWQLARQRLADYMRQRTVKTWYFAPPLPGGAGEASIPYDREIAENAAEGKVKGGNVDIWHTFPDNDIDWHYNPTSLQDSTRVDPEWQWQLCRMAFWKDLANAYRTTRDEKYAEAWVRQFRSFAGANPSPAAVNNRPGSTWRTIECGIRMGRSWPQAFHAFLNSPPMSDEDICQYVYYSMLHGRFLRAHPTPRGNWLMMEMSGLYTVGAVFPEFYESGEWRQFSIRSSVDSVASQFLPDGAQYELSPRYHGVALNNILAISTFARELGREDELPSNYVWLLEDAFDFTLAMMAPDGLTPRLNDSGRLNARALLSQASGLFPGREDYLWAATSGIAGEAPAYTSVELAWAGYVVMRSGWEPQANAVYFDVGPLGYAHVHQDKLNLVFYAYGREVLFDNGGGTYERSPWREYFTDTFSHNTVLVDGLPQRRQTSDRLANVSQGPIDCAFVDEETYSYAVGTYEDGYGNENNRPATHTRRVYFHKPDVVVVADTLIPADGEVHSYEARWNMDTTRTLYDGMTRTTISDDSGLPNMALTALKADGLDVYSASAQETPEKLGWNASAKTQPSNIPATTVVHKRDGVGPQSFVTLLVAVPPASEGEVASPVLDVEASSAEEFRVQLAGGRVLDIYVPEDPADEIDVIEDVWATGPTDGSTP